MAERDPQRPPVAHQADPRRRRHRLAIAIALCVVALCLAALWGWLSLGRSAAATHTAAPAAVPLLQAGQVLQLTQAQWQTASAERQVSLPHVFWSDALPPQGGLVRYRLQLRLDQLPASTLALYINKISLAGELRINGHDGGSCARATLAQARCLHQPQLLLPPIDAWRVGLNEIEFQVWGDARQANGLSPVNVGPLSLLNPVYNTRYFWQVEAVHMLTLALLTMGLLSLVYGIWLDPTQRTLCLLFGTSSIVNALCDLNILLEVPPVGIGLYSWFTFSIRLVSLQLFTVTVLAYFGRLPRWGWLHWGLWLGGPPALVWLSGNSLLVVKLLYLPVGAAVIVTALLAMRWAWRSRLANHRLMLVVTALLLLTGLWDFAKLVGGLSFDARFWLPYSYPGTLLVMGYLLLKLLADALKAQRKLSLSLEQQVADREAELRLTYANMMSAEQARIQAEERSALLGHVHDGLGSQLVSARVALSQGQIDVRRAAELLGECSDDLRLVVSALGHRQHTLARALADFRYRLQTRLAGTPPQLHWEIALHDAPEWPQREVLQLLRMLQEACNNVVKHAQAAQLHIGVVWRDGLLQLWVEDDGCGIPPALLAPANAAAAAGNSAGHGLRSLHQRAQQLGAQLQISSVPGRTRVAARWAPARHAQR